MMDRFWLVVILLVLVVAGVFVNLSALSDIEMKLNRVLARQMYADIKLNQLQN